MSMSGPQRYPGASTRYWHQGAWGGDRMESNTIVVHTTEGTSVPGYRGGGDAPNFTALPDFRNHDLNFYQHFDFDISSRALVNLSGGVETNTLNACQIELVGTCDPRHRHSWSGAEAGEDYLYWPDAPDWALKSLAKFIKWAHEHHGVRIHSGLDWLPYPDSYGNSSARMSSSEWLNFYGVCGHSHVPENDHGDPGDLKIERLLDFAKGATPPKAEDTTPQGGTSGPAEASHPARYQVEINGLSYGYGAHGKHVTAVGRRLVAKGFGRHYKEGPGPHWTDADTLNYSEYQQSLGYHGTDPHEAADGVPGESSLKELFGYLPGARPVVDLSRLREAARENPPAHGQPVTYSGVLIVEEALEEEGLLSHRYVDGHYGTTTVHAYSRWQQRLGYHGTQPGGAADGIPGYASLTELGQRHDFEVRR